MSSAASHVQPAPGTVEDCRSCSFAGYDGDYQTIQTCDAGPELEDEGQDVDAVDAAVTVWVQAGEVAPCPHHRAAWWTEEGAAEKFVAWCLTTFSDAEATP